MELSSHLKDIVEKDPSFFRANFPSRKKDFFDLIRNELQGRHVREVIALSHGDEIYMRYSLLHNKIVCKSPWMIIIGLWANLFSRFKIIYVTYT